MEHNWASVAYRLKGSGETGQIDLVANAIEADERLLASTEFLLEFVGHDSHYDWLESVTVEVIE
jgi:hypothetical protein